jgi:predicted dehydrogenase
MSLRIAPVEPDGTSSLGLGILGCAAIATKRVLPAVAMTAGVHLVAVGSRALPRAERITAEYGGRPLAGYEAVLDAADVDAVYVPLPCGIRAEWVERALLAGKHVLAEKPLTPGHRETARLVGLAKERELVLRENYMFPHHSQHAYVRRLVDEGAIGELRLFASTFAIPPRPEDDIRYRPDLGGGALLDVGGYPIRAATLFLGPELTVAGAVLRHDRRWPVDVGGALMTRPDGVTAQVSFGLDHMYSSHYQLLGSEGRITVDHVFTPPAGYRPSIVVDRQDQHHRTSIDPDDQFANAVAAFVTAVRADAADSDDAIVTQAKLVDELRRRALAS